MIGWMPAASVYFKDPDGHSLEVISVMDAPSDPAFGVASYSAWQARKAVSSEPSGAGGGRFPGTGPAS